MIIFKELEGFSSENVDPIRKQTAYLDGRLFNVPWVSRLISTILEGLLSFVTAADWCWSLVPSSCPSSILDSGCYWLTWYLPANCSTCQWLRRGVLGGSELPSVSRSWNKALTPPCCSLFSSLPRFCQECRETVTWERDIIEHLWCGRLFAGHFRCSFSSKPQKDLGNGPYWNFHLVDEATGSEMLTSYMAWKAQSVWFQNLKSFQSHCAESWKF